MLNRRQFVQTAAGAAVLASVKPVIAETGKLPQRELGGTGVKVPILGLGTVAVGNSFNEKGAVALINKAIDLGVTYFDTAPGSTRQASMTGYSRAHRYIASVLKERRKEVFIATKCLETDGSKTLELVQSNLKELGIERADILYTHAIGHASYVFDELVGDNGPMAALEKAKKDGLTRLVGVTGHNRPEKFAAVLKKRRIDVMMNAVNIVDRHTYAFEDTVWPIAREQKVGLVAMKVFGGGVFSCKMPKEMLKPSFRYALSVPGVAIAVIGMGTEAELEQNVAWAKEFQPMTADEAKELKRQSIELAKKWGTHLDKLDAKGESSRPLINT